MSFTYPPVANYSVTVKVDPVCDYCDEGLPLEDGWHTRVDPEGVEGEQRIPCAKAEAA